MTSIRVGTGLAEQALGFIFKVRVFLVLIDFIATEMVILALRHQIIVLSTPLRRGNLREPWRPQAFGLVSLAAWSRLRKGMNDEA